MDYNETIEYIHNIPKFSRVLGNDMLRALLEKMDDPQKQLKFIHIAGTNGKGSVSTMVSQTLINAGFKVGLFTSPYLERFNERIRINGIPIPDFDLAQTATYVRYISEKYDAAVSEFAFDTAVAFEYFKNNKCDFAVIEVGLGGKLDATNVIESSVVTGITAIGYDHCRYLGSTIDEISMNKLAIVKQGTPTVLYPLQEPIVFKNAEAVCRRMCSELIIPKAPADYHNRSFVYDSKRYHLGMYGKFQMYNAATAIEIIKVIRKSGYNISEADLEKGLAAAKINGRFEFILPNLIIDGAHNPSAVSSLLSSLEAFSKKINFLIAVMEDKDCSAIAKHISEFVKQTSSCVTVTELDMPRCIPSPELGRIFKEYDVNTQVIKNPKKAIDCIIKSTGSDELICVTGSLYLAGEIRKYLSSRIK